MQFELKFYTPFGKDSPDLAKGLSRTLGLQLLETHFKGRDISEINAVIEWADGFSADKYHNNISFYRILLPNLESVYENNLQEVFKYTCYIMVEVPEGFLVPFIYPKHIMDTDTGVSNQLKYCVDDTKLINHWVSLGCTSKVEG